MSVYKSTLALLRIDLLATLWRQGLLVVHNLDEEAPPRRAVALDLQRLNALRAQYDAST